MRAVVAQETHEPVFRSCEHPLREGEPEPDKKRERGGDPPNVGNQCVEPACLLMGMKFSLLGVG